MNRKLWIALLAATIVAAGCGKTGAPKAEGASEGAVAAKDEHGHAAGEEEAGHAEGEEGHKEGEAGHDEGHEEGLIELTPEQIRIAGIQTAPAANRFMQAELSVPGVVNPTTNAVAMVTPPVSGRVVRLMATVGDAVRKGQALAVIQSSELAQGTGAVAEAETRVLAAEAAVRQAAAQVDLARSRSRSAEQTLQRQRQLAKEGVFSQPSLQAAQNEVSEAQTELASSRSDIAAKQNVLNRAERLFTQGLVAGAEVDQARVDLQQAKIRQERAEQRLALAERAFERESRVSRSGLLNAREIQAAEAEVRAARLEIERERIGLRSAESAVVGARRAVANARANSSALRGGGPGGGSTVTLTAPISGVITERSASMGQAVERSSDLFDIQNLDSVFVTANVPEREIAKVRIGGTVRVTTDSASGRSFTGIVRIVGSRLDPKTRSLPVQVFVQNPEGLLRPEGFARVSLGTGGGGSVLAVPRSAIIGDEDAPALFVEEGGKYEHREVKLGRTSGGYVEVLSGIKAGEPVVVKGAFTLMSQQKKGELKGHEH
ncbi:MAG: efflux RND transporter periplasmic adaptor subunit [Fimbriimonas sp.]